MGEDFSTGPSTETQKISWGKMLREVQGKCLRLKENFRPFDCELVSEDPCSASIFLDDSSEKVPETIR